MTIELTKELAADLMQASLAHVTREYPNKLDHVMGSAEDVLGPKALHPLFYGSFDWHSCVHGWWSLLTLTRLHKDAEPVADVLALADAMFTAENIAAEIAYLNRPESSGFERPYGWAWLLMLAAELHRHDIPAVQAIAQRMQPMADCIVARFSAFLTIADYPIRVGAHPNTAFALRLALEYARTVGNSDFEALCIAKAHRWYGEDRNCQVWEPSQDDFLSPSLIEAELMRYALPPQDFAHWFAAYFTDAASLPKPLLSPPHVADRKDGKIAHLDGLALSRGWCLSALSYALDEPDSRRVQAQSAAALHIEGALPHIADDYMGSHWLASFVILALTTEPGKQRTL